MSTATLHSEKERTLVPKLRFQQFDGGWKEILLEDFAKRGSGHTPNKSYPEYYNGEINWISLTDSKKLDNGYIEFTNTKITQLGLDNSSAVLHPAGSVLLSRDAGVGKSAVMKHSMAVSQHFIVWSPKENVSSNWFLYNVLQILKPEFERIAIGNTIKTIGLPYFKKLKIIAPTFPEQQKIASFLSAVDEKIQQLSRKKELLSQYKKGVMQQLFSGKLRFKDENGKDYANWEEKKLGDIGTLKNGLNKDKTDFGFGSPFVNLMNVFGKSEIYNQEFDLVNSNEKEKILYNVLKGDVLFIRSSVKRSGVGETVIVQEDLLNTVYSGFLIRFRDDRKSLAQEFKKYCFSSQSFRDEILSYATSSANTNINQESLNKINIKLPCIEEQQKIAAFLSNIDTKIESADQQLNQTQSFKKGLLQQLFA